MEYTERTRRWLDQRVAETVRSGRHKPSYYDEDGRVAGLPVEHVLSLARALTVLESLSTIEFSTVLDVGAGTGWMAFLMREHLGAQPVTVDLSREFAVWSRTAFGIPSYVANAAALPFGDGSFDVVTCSEVIEHVEHPLAVLGELRRVASRAVVVTTQEGCVEPWLRGMMMAAASDDPHAERNYFLPADFAAFFGAGTEVGPLMQVPERVRLFDLRDVDDLATCVAEIASPIDRRRGVETFSGIGGAGSYGVHAVAASDGCRRRAPLPRPLLLEKILGSDRSLGGASGFRADWCPPSVAPRGASPTDVVEVCCPACRGPLRRGEADWTCTSCGASFAVERGVPMLIAPAAVAAANEERQRRRPEVADFAHALSRGRWRWSPARSGARAALRLRGFLRLPIGFRDKARLAWRMVGRGR